MNGDAIARHDQRPGFHKKCEARAGAKTGWNDFTTSVVDTAPGPNQNRLYSFFNNLQTFYDSIGQKEAAEAEKKSSNGTRVGMITYNDGDVQVAGPFTSDPMAKESYRGSYPAPAMLLDDGSLVTMFTSKRGTERGGREFMAYSVRASPDRTSLETPVKVVDSLDTPDQDLSVPCGGYYLDSAATYDPVRNKLYFAYSDVRNKRCQLFLTDSSDGGKSWSNARTISNPYAAIDTQYSNPSLAVNKDGVLALMWEGKFRSGCWNFASFENGSRLAKPTQLGTCTAAEMKPSRISTAYLWDSFFQADPTKPTSTARISLRDTWNGHLGRCSTHSR